MSKRKITNVQLENWDWMNGARLRVCFSDGLEFSANVDEALADEIGGVIMSRITEEADKAFSDLFMDLPVVDNEKTFGEIQPPNLVWSEEQDCWLDPDGDPIEPIEEGS